VQADRIAEEIDRRLGLAGEWLRERNVGLDSDGRRSPDGDGHDAVKRVARPPYAAAHLALDGGEPPVDAVVVQSDRIG
jgi:hypothetical protein